jgi:hypothetical protein
LCFLLGIDPIDHSIVSPSFRIRINIQIDVRCAAVLFCFWKQGQINAYLADCNFRMWKPGYNKSCRSFQYLSREYLFTNFGWIVWEICIFDAALCLLSVSLFGVESVQCRFKEPLMQNLCRHQPRKLYICSISFQLVLICYFSWSTTEVTIFKVYCPLDTGFSLNLCSVRTFSFTSCFKFN